MPFPNFDFDRMSFWLGFLVATFTWWLLSAVRPMLPVLRDRLRHAFNAYRQRNLAGAETYLLRETVRRAQRAHLAGSLFSLDEVLITPRLVAPPVSALPGEENVPEGTTAARLIPYLPDWPELTVPNGVPLITLGEAVQHGCPVAVIGQPGCGKSVALAHFAAQLAQQQRSAEDPARPLPLYMHVFDLETSLPEGGDPLDALRRSVIRMASLTAQPQITRFLQTVFDSSMRGQWQPVLVLDGLDELPPAEFRAAAAFLAALRERHPRLQQVAAASPTYLDGLVQAGFTPLGVAGWTAAQRREFLERWSALWTAHVTPEAARTAPELDIDPLLINNWLHGDVSCESPLEWTLKVWAAYAGDLTNGNASSLLDTFVNRYLPAASRPALDALAHTWVTRGVSSLNFDAVEELLTATAVAGPQPAPAADAPEEAPPQPAAAQKRLRKLTKETAIVSPGERMISALMNAGLLARHASGRMRFASPVLLGYLAGARLSDEDAASVAAYAPHWSAGEQSLRFAVSANPQIMWIAPILQSSCAPLHQGTLAAARWLPDVPVAAEWRTYLMRQLAGLVQNETEPLGLRARCAAALAASRDPAVAKLFRQLLAARDPAARQLALLACGALAQAAALRDMINLLADPDIAVRHTACLAIGALPGEPPLNTLVQILLESGEDLRQVAAETLAQRPADGRTLLEEAAASEDLLTRRAAVAGLACAPGDWARKRLEQVAVEDNQWVVRSSAALALETFNHPNPHIPRPLPPPSESPWLIQYAGRQGMGILPDQPATGVLLSALQNGSIDEKLAALEYLRAAPEEPVLQAVSQVLVSGRADLREPALLALWWASLAGTQLPVPQQI